MSARLFNRTRRTDDLPAKFRREGRWWLLPIYHLLQRSDLAREGIANSGSYRFADHLYANRPSGEGWFGRKLDALLLNLRAARGMRARCTEATAQMRAAHRPGVPFRVLTAPCGLPRDVRDFAASVDGVSIEYTGLDLDPAVLAAAEKFLAGSAVPSPRFVQGDALDAATWPAGEFDFISSTGLGEFLDDAALHVFYANVHRALAPGGVFFTSNLGLEPHAEWLLRTFELDAHYRTARELRAALAPLGWHTLEFSSDATGLSTFAHAVK